MVYMAVLFRRNSKNKQVERVTGGAGQTDFILQNVEYIPGKNDLDVYINGLLAYPNIDYIIESPSKVKLLEPLPEEAEILFIVR